MTQYSNRKTKILCFFFSPWNSLLFDRICFVNFCLMMSNVCDVSTMCVCLFWRYGGIRKKADLMLSRKNKALLLNTPVHYQFSMKTESHSMLNVCWKITKTHSPPSRHTHNIIFSFFFLFLHRFVFSRTSPYRIQNVLNHRFGFPLVDLFFLNIFLFIRARTHFHIYCSFHISFDAFSNVQFRSTYEFVVYTFVLNSTLRLYRCMCVCARKCNRVESRDRRKTNRKGRITSKCDALRLHISTLSLDR